MKWTELHYDASICFCYVEFGTDAKCRDALASLGSRKSSRSNRQSECVVTPAGPRFLKLAYPQAKAKNTFQKYVRDHWPGAKCTPRLAIEVPAENLAVSVRTKDLPAHRFWKKRSIGQQAESTEPVVHHVPTGLLPIKALQFLNSASMTQGEAAEYKLGRVLGEGSFGKVFQAVSSSGGEWAVKILKSVEERQRMGVKSGRRWELSVRFLEELHMNVRVCGGPNVVPIHDVCNIHGELGMVFKLADSDLYQLIHSQHKFLCKEDLRRASVDIFTGLRHIHEQGIIHLDVSLKNVLRIGDHGCQHFALSDFGSASTTAFPEICNARLGGELGVQTLPYRAPEVIAQCAECFQRHPDRIDIWAAACVLFEASTGHPPWPCTCEWSLAVSMVKNFGYAEFIDFSESAAKTFEKVPRCSGVPLSPPRQVFGHSGAVFWQGVLIPHPSKRPSAAQSLQSFAYLQERPILLSRRDGNGSVIVPGRCASSVVQENDVEPALLEKMRGDCNDDVFKRLHLCWDPATLEGTGRANAESIDGVVVKISISGHDGIKPNSATMNKLSLGEVLPFPWVCRFLRALHRINAYAYEAATPLVRQELVRRLPAEWIAACPPRPAKIEGRIQHLRDFLHAPFPLNDAPQIHVQRVEEERVRELQRHRDGGHGAYVLALGLWTGRDIELYAGPDDAHHMTIKSRSGHCYGAGLMGTTHKVIHPSGPRDCLASEVLGPVEIVLLVRSTCFSHNRMANARLCFRDNVDGQVCAAVSEAIAKWQQRYPLRLPSLADVVAEPAAPITVRKRRKVING